MTFASLVVLAAALALPPGQDPSQDPVAAAQALLDRGWLEEALGAFSAAAANPRFAARASVGAARAAARLERADDAFRWLAQAVGAGWGDRAELASDAALRVLVDDPRFAAVLPALVDGDDAFVEDVRVLHTWNGEAGGDQYGWVTRRVGDLDGDGVCDFASTAPSANGWRGRAYVLSSRTGDELFRTEGDVPGARLGNAVAGEVDVDADGVDDVITGAPGTAQVPGSVRVLSGRVPGSEGGRVLWNLTQGIAGDQYGVKVSGIEDLDGDGHAEICVGASGLGAGKVVVVSGRTGEDLYEIPGEAEGDGFGQSLDGSRRGGHRLLAVGAPTAGARKTGRVYLYRLGAAGAERLFTWDADATGGSFGQYFVTLFGDVDGDAVPDVYASDFSNAATGPGTGRVYVFSGASGKQLLSITGHRPGEGFGTTAAVCGDANGDGAADLIIGAWQHADVAPSAGACYLHSGRDGALLAKWTCTQAHDTLGFDAIGVGDADGDGNDDFVLSSAWSIVERGRQGRVFLVAGPGLRPETEPEVRPMVRRLGTGMGFVEGPVWLEAEQRLVFSDIPARRHMAWTRDGGVVELGEMDHPNGNAVDAEGRLVTCLHGARSLVRRDGEGAWTTLLERVDGRRFNSPNDLAIQADGVIWFTDPPWGLEGQRAGRELPGHFVFRFDPRTGDVRAVIEGLCMPNGIALSPDGARLFVSDTGGHPSHPDAARHGRPATISAYALEGGELVADEPLWSIEALSDGMCVDELGRIYATAEGGIEVWSPDGEPVSEIPIPERPANATFGGPDGRTLFVTARTSLYAVGLSVRGARQLVR